MVCLMQSIPWSLALTVNPNIKRIWAEWVIENGAWQTELVVETDLETRATATGYDDQKFVAMVTDAASENATGTYTRIRIIPVGVR